MGLIRYNKDNVAQYDLRRHIERWTGERLDEATSEAIDHWVRRRIVLSEDPKKVPSALMRLTIPLFMVYWLLLALVLLPIQWLITGKYFMDEKSILLGPFRAWGQRLFPNL